MSHSEEEEVIEINVNSNGKNKIVCRYCGYSWVSRVEKPRACPRCKIYIKWEDWIKKEMWSKV